MTPLSIPADAEGVLFFGGTFDPPHAAHARIPAEIRDRVLGRRWVLVYVPAARSPHKDAAPTEAKHRVEMVRLTVRGTARCVVWTDEIDRSVDGRASYTLDTLRRARSVLERSLGMRLLIGSDQAAAMHRWREPRTVVELAPPVVMVRPPHRSAADVERALAESSYWNAAELVAWADRIDGGSVMEASSSEIRRRIRAGEGVSGLVTPEVEAYIRRHGLYGV